MAKKHKVVLTPYERLVASNTRLLKSMEIKLGDMQKSHRDEEDALRAKIAARREIVAKLKG